MPGTVLSTYTYFSFLILPKSYEKGTMMHSGCGLGCGCFRSQILPFLPPPLQGSQPKSIFTKESAK